MKLFNFFIIFAFSLFICSCATTTADPASLYKEKNEAQLFHDGQQAMLKKDNDIAIKHFEVVDARYPFGKYARQAQLDIVYAYYQHSDTASALAAANRYIHLYPRGANVDYAYYMRGLIEFNQNIGFFEKFFPVDYAKRDLTSLKRSFRDFNRLLHYFPNSRYAPDARQRMIYIRNILAKHELLIAQFYLERGMYVAAANRANEVVRHYQRTPSVPKALVVMEKAYRQLHMNKEADDSARVLKANFPE